MSLVNIVCCKSCQSVVGPCVIDKGEFATTLLCPQGR